MGVESPRRATAHSAGYDFTMPRDLIVDGHSIARVDMGVTIELERDQFLQLKGRSGTNYFTILEGVIDADFYPRPIIFVIRNQSCNPIKLYRGQRIGQGIILPYLRTSDDYPAAKIREGGFGSTGE